MIRKMAVVIVVVIAMGFLATQVQAITPWSKPPEPQEISLTQEVVGPIFRIANWVVVVPPENCSVGKLHWKNSGHNLTEVLYLSGVYVYPEPGGELWLGGMCRSGGWTLEAVQPGDVIELESDGATVTAMEALPPTKFNQIMVDLHLYPQ